MLLLNSHAFDGRNVDWQQCQWHSWFHVSRISTSSRERAPSGSAWVLQSVVWPEAQLCLAVSITCHSVVWPEAASLFSSSACVNVQRAAWRGDSGDSGECGSCMTLRVVFLQQPRLVRLRGTSVANIECQGVENICCRYGRWKVA